MPLNKGKSKQTQKAASELAKKLKLEARMKRELREFFNIMSVDFAALYALTGHVLSAASYSDDLRGIVSRHYRRTARAFIGDKEEGGGGIIFFFRSKANRKDPMVVALTAIAISRGIKLKELIDEIEQRTRLGIAAMIATRVPFDVVSITKTNQKILDNSIVVARRKLTEDLGRIPTRQEVAASASRKFRKTSLNRTGTIAATITQGAAEGTKQIERDNFFQVRNSLESRELGLERMEPKEIWVSQGDSLVRTGDFNHLAADFQEKKNGAFTVSRQKLRFPGDRSLGATSGNVINCRCSAITVIEEEADIPVAIQVQEIQDNTDFGPETVAVTLPGN